MRFLSGTHRRRCTSGVHPNGAQLVKKMSNKNVLHFEKERGVGDEIEMGGG